MRGFLLLGWLLIPIGLVLYHHGPGQDWLQLDDASNLLASGDRYVAAGEYAEAVACYDEALKRLPSSHSGQARRIRLEKAKAQLLCSQLPLAYTELHNLCEELQGDPSADRKLLAEARSAQAQSQYYLTWLMRLEGQPRDAWEPEIEAARQTYRLLAEQADTQGDSAGANKAREDLEAAIRLARMDLGELQGLALPCQCSGCKSCKGKSRSVNKGKSQSKPEDARGASSGPPPDTSGH